MKYILFLLLPVFLSSCRDKATKDETENKIHKEDISKIKWIEGTWKGDYYSEPFYETYRMVNDSTIQIMTYMYLGSDTMSTTSNYFHWQDGAYYLGAALNYKAEKITDREIKMVPYGQASNDILWSYVNDSSWTALLTSASDTVNYTMQKVPPMDSILSVIKYPSGKK